MTMRFSLHSWAAWAPGLNDQAAWRHWLAQPCTLTSQDSPALQAMPAMMRRRLDRLGRAALQAAYECQNDQPAYPTIFASRYGEVSRSLTLLEDLARQTAMSPTAFSLSVHNAIGAIYSIARGDKGNYSAIAAGVDTVPSAFIEAAGLLADGAASVLVVIYEDELPATYAQFSSGPAMTHAWACLLVAAESSGFSLSLHAQPQTSARPDHNHELPADLEVLQFLLSEQACLQQGRWQWQRHA